ncbi:MAG: tRNA lysidine(34) synthetase TilS, partial [Microbacterium sp.]
MLDPAIAAIRLAVRNALTPYADQTVLVALSGGADSLALAAAAAYEARARNIRVISVTVDHALQPGSDGVAARAAQQAADLGIADARTVRVDVGETGGPEAAARDARYAALLSVAVDVDAAAVLLGHTLDDQAEGVLLGLARGAGAGSLAGMPPRREHATGLIWERPLLSVRRETTRAFCAASGIEPWHDPHNDDPRYARVRVRQTILPLLETELGPGIAEALWRTAEQLREDNEAFQDMIDEVIEDICEHAEAGISISVDALLANPPALRNRIIRYVASSEFDVSLTRAQTLEIARLVTDWRGQGPLDLPGFTAARAGSSLVL